LEVHADVDRGRGGEPTRRLTFGALSRDAAAGAVSAVVLLTSIVSFASLMFPGALAAGAPIALWAMLVGSGVTGLWIALRTSLPPISSGTDSATVAIFVLLVGQVSAAVTSAGGSVAAATQASMLALTGATAVSGVLLYALGLARRGHALRFVPYFVVAGFLAATGWLLFVGGVRMSLGRDPLSPGPGITATEWARVASGVAVFALLLLSRRHVRSALALPLTLLGLIVAGALVLHGLGLGGRDQGWYLPAPDTLVAWSPWAAWQAWPLPARETLALLPELLAVSAVVVVSLVSKVAALEVARQCPADLDQELRAHGLGTLAAVPLGGHAAMMGLGTSRLLEAAGGATRLSGAACAVMLLAVGLSGVDLLALVPLPILVGLVFYLGWGFVVDGLGRLAAQRDVRNGLLALAIGAACVSVGYLAGVLGGIVAASLLFAASYARLGAVRLHLSRTLYEGHVSRPAEASRRLREAGEQIQIHWLAGYLFFGSSESVFDHVRRTLQDRPAGSVRYVILDFDRVTGADASAALSLAKLRHLCSRAGVVLVFSAVAPGIAAALAREGVYARGGTPDVPTPFDDVNTALAWCEERVLAAAEGAPGSDSGSGGALGTSEADEEAGFAAWLQDELGVESGADFLLRLQRRRFEAAATLYRQGDAADAIDLVAVGRLVIELVGPDGRRHRLRTLSARTAVGEMGFIRRLPRSATVKTEGPATVYTLSRAAFDQLRRERPDLAAAFEEFLLRSLADRLMVTQRMVSALSG
jgi:SulP family sulfate permease